MMLPIGEKNMNSTKNISFLRLISLISLSLFFYIILTPLGMIIRVLGFDFLKQKINKKTKSYWESKI